MTRDHHPQFDVVDAPVPPEHEPPADSQRKRSNRHRVWAVTAGLMTFYLCLGLALRYPHETAKAPVTGDEHHYLTQAFSVIHDGDLTVLNNYFDGDYVTFYGSPLNPSAWNLQGLRGYSAHAPGAGLLVVPGMWAAGWVGVLATLAGAMAATFAITASILARLLQGPLPTSGLLLLTTGFVALPLLAYSHTLYPESFMALVVAALGLMTVIQLQATGRATRTWACLASISLSGLSMALHPKYFVVLLGVTTFCTFLEVSDASMGPFSVRMRTASAYIGLCGIWLLLFAWFHDIMWDVFHPAGWFAELGGRFRVESARAFTQLLDLFFGRENGLFILAPLTILSVVFLFHAFRRGSERVQRRFGVFVLVLAGSIVGPAAFSRDWHGGDTPLGRYATPLTAILLLMSVVAAMQRPWTIGRRVLLGILVALGLLGGFIYSAQPNAFRPQPGSGALAVVSENVSLLADLESWFWSATSPRLPWVGPTLWILLVGMALWMFARPDHHVPQVPPEDPEVTDDLPSSESSDRGAPISSQDRA